MVQIVDRISFLPRIDIIILDHMFWKLPKVKLGIFMNWTLTNMRNYQEISNEVKDNCEFFLIFD